MIAVTGATGQLGGLIIENLMSQGMAAAEITAVVRAEEKAAGLVSQGVQIRQGDYGDFQALVTAFAGIDTLMFISNTDFAVREQQHNNVVAAAKQAGVLWIIYTSFVDGGVPNPIGASHYQTEQMIRDSGIPWTFLRNNFYMDITVPAVEGAMKSGVYRIPTGIDAGAALVTREDIARTAAAVLTAKGHAGKIYNLTGPAPVSPRDIVHMAKELSGKFVTYEQITWAELVASFTAAGMPEGAARGAASAEQLIASGALTNVSTDIEQITGEPPEDFGSFIRRSL